MATERAPGMKPRTLALVALIIVVMYGAPIAAWYLACWLVEL